ncbi:unnamed protein product, partial [Ectocarpus sp. 8 AP-2014]
VHVSVTTIFSHDNTVAPCCRFTLMHAELWSCGWCWTCNVLDNTAICLQPKPVPQALFSVFGSKVHTLKPERVPTEIP